MKTFMMDIKPKEDDVCPHCNKGTLVLVLADVPWTDNHLQCSVCDSTYVI